MKHLPIDMPITIAEQDEVLDRIFAMVDTGDETRRTSSKPSGRSLPRAKKQAPSRRYGIMVSAEEHRMLEEISLIAEIRPEGCRRGRAAALLSAIQCVRWCWENDPPKQEWVDWYKDHIRVFGVSSAHVQGSFPAADLEAMRDVSKAMGVSFRAAIRAAILNLYLVMCSNKKPDDVGQKTL